MEEVEITTTLEIMADSSLITGPWRVTALVEEIQGDPMVVSFTPQIHFISSDITSEFSLIYFVVNNP